MTNIAPNRISGVVHHVSVTGIRQMCDSVRLCLLYSAKSVKKSMIWLHIATVILKFLVFFMPEKRGKRIRLNREIL